MRLSSPASGTARPGVLAIAALLVGAACSAAATPTATPTLANPTANPTATHAASAASGETSGPAYEVKVANAANLGDFLVGKDSRTLYTLKTDGPSATTCTGGCATTWPPFTLDNGEKVIAGPGLTGRFGTFARPDGKTQVTYNGAALYYYAGDSKAGDTKGQGVGGVWFVASAGTAAAPSAAPTTQPSRYSY